MGSQALNLWKLDAIAELTDFAWPSKWMGISAYDYLTFGNDSHGASPKKKSTFLKLSIPEVDVAVCRNVGLLHVPST